MENDTVRHLQKKPNMHSYHNFFLWKILRKPKKIIQHKGKEISENLNYNSYIQSHLEKEKGGAWTWLQWSQKPCCQCRVPGCSNR